MTATPRHQCLIYNSSPVEHLTALASSIDFKLKENFRCLYLNSPAMVAGMRSKLAAKGLDLDAASNCGALILTSDQSHLKNGIFDIDEMLNMLSSALEKSLSDGYAGLWASGDITWELGGENNFEKILEYEKRLDEFMQNNSALSGVCQYHQSTLPPKATMAAALYHPAFYVNDTLSRLNDEYRAQSA